MTNLPSEASAGDGFDSVLRVLVPAPRVGLRSGCPSVSVVIPAKNEAKNLPWVAERMPEGITEVILVDGHSTDDTVAVARQLWPAVRVIGQTRKGKGNALACGFEAARGDIIVMIDADGSMDPGEIPYFVEALLDGADYAKGSRFTDGGGSADITRIRTAGNRALNLVTSWVHNTSYSDLCYGYNAFWRHVLPAMALDAGELDGDITEQRYGDGFEVETLINVRVHLAGLKITEVPSFESVRLNGVSNLNAVSDGLRVLRTIARESQLVQDLTPRRWAPTTGLGAHAADGQANVWALEPVAVEGVEGDITIDLRGTTDLSSAVLPDDLSAAME